MPGPKIEAIPALITESSPPASGDAVGRQADAKNDSAGLVKFLQLLECDPAEGSDRGKNDCAEPLGADDQLVTFDMRAGKVFVVRDIVIPVMIDNSRMIRV